MRIAFFDAKPYDKPSFDRFGQEKGIKFKYFEAKLNEDTVDLAAGYDGVCAFVNDTVNAAVIDKLYAYGVKLIALRSAGYNNVDVKAAFGSIAYAGILSTGIAFTLQIVGQKDLDPTPAAVIMSMESVVAVICGALILKETMTMWELSGCVLMFIAVILSQMPEKKK